MKIKKLEAIPIKLQMKKPFVIANVTNYDMFYIIVRLETDQGIVGYGEATPAWEVTGETCESVIGFINLITTGSLLGYTLIGMEIENLNQITRIIEEISGTNKPQLIYGNTAAKAAIEQSILDAYGKSVGKPIHKLLNAEKKPIPFTKNISIFDVDTTLNEVKIGIEEGYKIIRLKVGIEKCFGFDDYQRDAEVIKESFQMIKKHRIKLVADANQGFIDSERTINFCKKIEGQLDWLEQPVLASDLTAFSEIKNKTSVPLMADESIHSAASLKILLELGRIDFINIKLMKTGGLIPALKLAALAEENKIGFQIGSMLESSIGSAMGCQLYFLKSNAISTDLNSFDLLKTNIAEGILIKSNRLYLSDLPGSGVNLSEEYLSKLRNKNLS